MPRTRRLHLLPPDVDFRALAQAALSGDEHEVERILDDEVFRFDGRGAKILEAISDVLIGVTVPLVMGLVGAVRP